MPEELVAPHDGVGESDVHRLPSAENPGPELVADALRVEFPPRGHLGDENLVVVIDHRLEPMALLLGQVPVRVVQVLSAARGDVLLADAARGVDQQHHSTGLARFQGVQLIRHLVAVGSGGE